jgi:hypothetical protein
VTFCSNSIIDSNINGTPLRVLRASAVRPFSHEGGAALRLKESKRPRARRRDLIKPGINPSEVYRASRSRKGYWRMSQHSLVRFALNNAYLKERGVPEPRLPCRDSGVMEAKPGPQSRRSRQ